MSDEAYKRGYGRRTDERKKIRSANLSELRDANGKI